MFIGYARVSTEEQETTVQEKALLDAGCEKIFLEKASGGRWDRPELHRLFDQLRQDDILVVWKLDRLSRSLRDVLLILEKIDQVGADFRSLTESVDTTSAAGRMMMHIVASFAEFERAMIQERTRAGLEEARRQGRIGGRSRKLQEHQRQEITHLIHSGQLTPAAAARLFGVHRSTVTRLLQRESANQPSPEIP